MLKEGDRFGATANRGIVIRSWNARLGGKECVPWIAEHGVSGRNSESSTIDIVTPPGLTRLEAGDFIEATIEHVIVPQFAAQYYGANVELRTALGKHGNTWGMIHREATGNDLDVEIRTGALLRTSPGIAIQLTGGIAEFTLSKGLAYLPVTFSGLESHRGYVLEIDGKRLDQSVHGNDFWQTGFDEATGLWTRTYNIPAPGDEKCEVRFFPGE